MGEGGLDKKKKGGRKGGERRGRRKEGETQKGGKDLFKLFSLKSGVSFLEHHESFWTNEKIKIS